MILVVAATEIEMGPFIEVMACKQASELEMCSLRTLVSGVGPVATVQNLTRYLLEEDDKPDLLVNFGIGGAYIQPQQDKQPQLLDLCLAEKEIFGDFGICMHDGIEYLDPDLTGPLVYALDSKIKDRALDFLSNFGYPVHKGNFVTVNSVTGIRSRGDFLQQKWGALCENMEGASVAKLCSDFAIPCVELRCVSNFVEDRDPSSWRLLEACARAAEAGFNLVTELMNDYEKFP